MLLVKSQYLVQARAASAPCTSPSPARPKCGLWCRPKPSHRARHQALLAAAHVGQRAVSAGERIGEEAQWDLPTEATRWC